MNFLELAKAVARESGSLSPDAISSVTGLSGRPDKIVNWVRTAYNNIQRSRNDWGWLMAPWTGALIPGTAVYTPASFNLTRFSRWAKDRDWYMPVTLYDPVTGISDEVALRNISHEAWKTMYDRGDTTSTYWNRPVDFAISPRNEIVFGPIPDKAYVVRGQYQKGPQSLTNTTDIPEMPTRFHDLIVREAIRLMLIHDGAYQEAQFEALEQAGMRFDLELDQLPEVVIP